MQKNNYKINVSKLFITLICIKLTFSFVAHADDTDNAEALTANCSACHGEQGISSSDIWPNLAGQQSKYLENQILAFRDNKRDAPLMLPFVKNLTNAQIVVIANYYTSLPSSKPVVATINSAGRNVRAYCVSCHGLSGNSVISEWPNLAGQKKSYLAQQLKAYKSGARQHPLMNVIANELTEQQITDVAEYYSQISMEEEFIDR